MLAALILFCNSCNTGNNQRLSERIRKLQEDKKLVVRVAKLQIDSTQLENYKALLKEEIETSVKAETGVLGLYAVADKSDPSRITIMEIYADTNAYKAHLQTPHFKKYKNGTMQMVRSLELIETNPIALGIKQDGDAGF